MDYAFWFRCNLVVLACDFILDLAKKLDHQYVVGVEEQMNEDERLVRKTWNSVELDSGRWGASVKINCERPLGVSSTKTDAWSAAAEFTRKRLEEIRQVEEEIKALARNSYVGYEYYYQVLEGVRDIVPRVRHHHALSRILAREQAVLGALKKGMKP